MSRVSLSVIEKILKAYVEDYSALSKSDRRIIYQNVLLYVFGCISSAEFTSRLKEISPTTNCKNLRLRVTTSGYILKDVKLFIHAKVTYFGYARGVYSISDTDRAIISKILKDPSVFAKVKKAVRGGCKPLVPEKMDKLVADALQEIRVYTAKFINRKMKFILQSTGMDMVDIQQDLFSWAAYSIYKAYPKIDSVLHAVNIAKRSTHNRGINLIMEYTTKSRSRFNRNSDGTFSSVNVPLHSMVSPVPAGETLTQCNYLVTDITGRSANNKSVDEVREANDLRLSVKMFYSKMPLKMKRLMNLWAGKHDENFSTWLGKPNDVWFEEADRVEYLVSAVDYLKIDRKVARTFLNTLKEKFSDYRNC